MLLTIAIIVVVVLLAVALLPMKKREPEQLRQASPVAFLTPEPAQPVRQTTFVNNSSTKRRPPLPLNTNDGLTQFGWRKCVARHRSCSVGNNDDRLASVFFLCR